LLPFDPLHGKAETIFVLNTERFSEQDRALLKRVRDELFQGVSFAKEEEAYWIGQQGGGSGNCKKADDCCYQVLVVASAEKPLKGLLDELWNWPGNKRYGGGLFSHGSARQCPNGQPGDWVNDENGRYWAIAHHVRHVYVATNDEAVEAELGAVFNGPRGAYDLLTCCRLHEDSSPQALDAFLSPQPWQIRITALNWNAEKEVDIEVARRLLPKGVVDEAMQRPKDPRGLTGWQQFCRAGFVRRSQNEDADETVAGAPCTRQLLALLGTRPGAEAPVVTDISDCRSLAVGVHLLDKKLPFERLVAQQKIEQLARDGLEQSQVPDERKRIGIVSSENLGQILVGVLGSDAQTPWTTPEGAQTVVNATNADFLLLLWAQSLTPTTLPGVDTPIRNPEPMPPFTEAEPMPPNLSARKYPFGPKVYTGPEDPKYIDAMNTWRIRHATWQQHKDADKAARQGRQVQWLFHKYQQPRTRLNGYLKLIDLHSRQTVWSMDLQLEQNGAKIDAGNEPITAVGDDTQPRQPNLPPVQNEWTEPTYDAAQAVLQEALRQGVARLRLLALMPSDLRDWSAAPKPVDFGLEWFVLVGKDGLERECQLQNPVVLMDGGERREMETADLAAQLRGGGQAVSFGGATLQIRDRVKEEAIAPGSIASIKLPPPPRVTSRPYVVTLTDGSVTGPLLLQGLEVDDPVLGKTARAADELEKLEEIAIDDGGIRVKLGGRSFVGKPASSPLHVRVGQDDQEIPWSKLRGIALYAPPPAKPFGFEMADGSRKTGAFAEDSIPIAGYDRPLAVARIVSASIVPPDHAKITLDDNSVREVTFQTPNVRVVLEGTADAASLAWQDIRSVGPPSAPVRRYVPKGKVVVQGGCPYLPLGDLMSAVGTANPAIKRDGAAYVISIPAGSARFKPGDGCVWVGTQQLKLPAPIIMSGGAVYFPVGALKPLWEYDVNQVNDGFRCVKRQEEFVIIAATQ